MPMTTSFRDLDVWQESMLLVEDIYRITRKFPREKRLNFGAAGELIEVQPRID